MKRASSLKRRTGQTAAIILALAMTGFAAIRHDGWPAYGHGPGGDRFSPLKQVNTKNVNDLHVAWVYNTGEKGMFFETTPIVVGNRMYFTTPSEQVVALSATTGKKIWSFDPHLQRAFHHRGVSYWPGDAHHAPRIILATTDGNLYALDAATGKPIATFGDKGVVDLKAGVATPAVPHPRLGITSPPAIYRNLLILGPETQEGPSSGPSGDPRAFNVITGKQVWRFHTVPRPGEPGNQSWGPGGWKNRAGPSAWGMITVDVKRGLVFIPVGNPAGNMYGADRKGKDLYSASVICLRASTGKLVWYFQLVHHDIWDYDVAAAPALIAVHHNGQSIPAVVAIDKDGLMYILNELTGKPVYGVEERPVPKSDVPGEQSWPTQPFPLKPPPLAQMSINAKELNKLTPQSAKFCAELFSKYHNDGPFTPYGTKPTVAFPSTIGGSNWNGVSYDPRLGYIFANISNVGAMGQMVPNTGSGAGRAAGRGRRGFSQSAGMAYRNKTAYARFRDQNHYPCNAPPWGQLIAVNANTGNIAWKSVLGEYPALKAKGILHTGTPNLGGSIATAGGLVFVGATADHHFRAFDARTGKTLWSIKLDGYVDATPITYTGSNGKQYVVVADGSIGPFLGTFLPHIEPVQAKVVAFALPPIPPIPGSSGSIASVLAPATNTSARPAVELPAGPGRELVMTKCTVCHGMETVTAKHRSGKQWTQAIHQMISYGASASEQQFTAIESYLTAHYGKAVNVNQASAAELENDLLLSQRTAEAIVKYRAAHGHFKSMSDIQKVPGINTAQIKAQQANIQF